MRKGFYLKLLAARERIQRCERDLGYSIGRGSAVDLILDQAVVDDLRRAKEIISSVYAMFPMYPPGIFIVRMRDEDGTWYRTEEGWSMLRAEALSTNNDTAHELADKFNRHCHDRIVGQAVVVNRSL